MKDNKTLIEVGVSDNSTDWGTIGYATSTEDAVTKGRAWADEHSTQSRIIGRGPVIRMRNVDPETREPISDTSEVKAW
jgi:hypothetical protein